MINYRLLNKSEMKNYLSNRVGYEISEIDFQNSIEYIVDFDYRYKSMDEILNMQNNIIIIYKLKERIMIINVQNMGGYYLVMEFIEGSVVNLVIGKDVDKCVNLGVDVDMGFNIEKVIVFRKNGDVIRDLWKMNKEEIRVHEKYMKLVEYSDKFVSVLKYRSEYVD